MAVAARREGSDDIALGQLTARAYHFAHGCFGGTADHGAKHFPAILQDSSVSSQRTLRGERR